MKRFSYLFWLWLILFTYNCGGGGGGETAAIDPQEAASVQEVYNIFKSEYFYPLNVRAPSAGETVREYIDSYRSTSDIYTQYFTQPEIENISNVLSTPETLIVRTYDPGILYIAFEKFVSGTANRIIDTIGSYMNQGYNNLILDLRVNSGGSPYEALYLLDYFTTSQPDNTFLAGFYGPQLTEEHYTGQFKPTFGFESSFNSSNMYILTSGYTASAAELFIAGLIYFNEATQIGTTTFGKNRLVRFYTNSIRNDGFEITVAYVYHADVMDREGIGIIPTFNNLSYDPFIDILTRLNANGTDMLQQDWNLSDISYANLYNHDYWRNIVYYALVYQSLSILKPLD